VLDPKDRELLVHICELGGGALPEVAAHAGGSIDRLAGGDFAENGAASYREHRGHTLIALAGVTEGHLTQAANRAEADKIGERFERSAATAEAMKQNLIVRLDSLGGASSLDGAKRALAAAGYPREAIRPALAERHERGWIRVNIKGAAPQAGERDTRTRFVTLYGSPEGVLASAAKRHADDEKEIPGRRAEAADQACHRG
jgi:hypothetical protein